MPTSLTPVQITSDWVFFKLYTTNLFVSLDPNTHILTFNATVPMNSWFSIGFG